MAGFRNGEIPVAGIRGEPISGSWFPTIRFLVGRICVVGAAKPSILQQKKLVGRAVRGRALQRGSPA
ncbi:transporter, partial [Klebsiella pneumoniae]|nr:transporter [Klebsiella pneumoniae]